MHAKFFLHTSRSCLWNKSKVSVIETCHHHLPSMQVGLYISSEPPSSQSSPPNIFHQHPYLYTPSNEHHIDHCLLQRPSPTSLVTFLVASHILSWHVLSLRTYSPTVGRHVCHWRHSGIRSHHHPCRPRPHQLENSHQCSSEHDWRPEEPESRLGHWVWQ
jgi:hypothetical protein